VIVEKAVEIKLPDAGAAELALVQDRQQERREERDGRVPEIDGPHLSTGDVQRQALLDRCEKRLERGLEVAGPDARVVQTFGEPHHVCPDAPHVPQAECRAVEHPPDGVLERVLGRRDERPVSRRFAALPDQVCLQDALAIREVVTQRRHAHAGGAGHLSKAGPCP
jgi:hypothetical protein